MKILVTGAAGFIGMHLSKKVLSRGIEVIGIDNLNDYYSIELKKNRLKELEAFDNFTFVKCDLANFEDLEKVFKEFSPEIVINLAAQAGVRYSIENPFTYINSNIVGFTNLIELSRLFKIKNYIYASSSSVYGASKRFPFSEEDPVNHPMSLYAATKKSNELIAHTYSSIHGLPTIGLRFFTVYGPWGRPDMALFTFTNNIVNNIPIDVYNNGNMLRDFTYVEDIVESISRLIDLPAKSNESWVGETPTFSDSYAPYRIYNIGNNNPVKLLDFIEEIEKNLGKRAIKNYKPLQPGDVPETYADVTRLINETGYKPKTSIEAGIKSFVEWYIKYYEVKI